MAEFDALLKKRHKSSRNTKTVDQKYKDEYHEESPGNVKDKLAYSYITQQYKNNIVTDQKLCRGSKELHHMASSYLCYLKSNRKYQSLFNEYHSKSNRSIAETAGIVGLRVPKTYDA
ncbi:Protein FMC1 [Nymphon striatum]|nr:Protein FMC1 [Nymphon striatum]